LAGKKEEVGVKIHAPTRNPLYLLQPQ